jgi:hypothetical protein
MVILDQEDTIPLLTSQPLDGHGVVRGATPGMLDRHRGIAPPANYQ